MIVKPAISFLTTDNDSLLINDCSVVLTGVGGNADIYKTPQPPLATVQTALDNFSDGVVVARTGGQADVSRKNNLRLILIGLMRQLANYVSIACNGDMTNLLLSGFPVQKPTRQPIGPLPAPGNVTLVLGNHSGELQAKANAVFGAAIYTWSLTASTPGAAVQTVQTTAARVTFAGLTPGVTYTVTVIAIGTSGPSDPSNPATQMAV